MRAEEILVHLRKLPFVPIRIHLSDGSSYVVHRRELMLVTRREVVIGPSPGKGDIPERSVYCDPVHVTRIEQITPNGRGRRKSNRSL